MVKLLLEKEVEPDSKSDYNWISLSWVSKKGNEVLVKLLLEKEFNPDSKQSEYGQTPLLSTAENVKDAVVKLLVECNSVDPDSEDKNGETPMF